MSNGIYRLPCCYSSFEPLKSIPTNAVINQVEADQQSIGKQHDMYVAIGYPNIPYQRMRQRQPGYQASSQEKHNMGDATTTINHGTGKSLFLRLPGISLRNYRQTSSTEQRIAGRYAFNIQQNKYQRLKKWRTVIRIGTISFKQGRNTFRRTCGTGTQRPVSDNSQTKIFNNQSGRRYNICWI